MVEEGRVLITCGYMKVTTIISAYIHVCYLLPDDCVHVFIADFTGEQQNSVVQTTSIKTEAVYLTYIFFLNLVT